MDFSLFEYTFVGNVTEQFRNIKIIPPVDSETLAQYLKQHDIYLTASQNDPCSNALIEALSCGLPAVYLNSGGHPELVSFGGLGFDKPEEIPGQIAKLATNYEAFQNLITVNDIDEVTEKYLKVVRAAVGDESKKTGFLKNILQKFIK